MNGQVDTRMFRAWYAIAAWVRAIPIVTLLMVVLAVVSGAAPSWDVALSYQREAILRGQVWRLGTGHLTHWNRNHLFWDVLMFGVLASIVECRQRKRALGLLVGSALAISAALWWASPQVTEYRGLSGVDSALFVYVAIVLARDARLAGRNAFVGVVGLLLAGFAGKIGYELCTGDTLFVDSSSGAFTPLPLAHVVGGIAGALFTALEFRTVFLMKHGSRWAAPVASFRSASAE